MMWSDIRHRRAHVAGIIVTLVAIVITRS